MAGTGAHLSALTASSQAFADLAADADLLDRPVPSCPGWTVADLVGHLGSVYGWTEMAVAAGGEKPTAPRPAPPAGRERLAAWFVERRDGAVDALTSRQPDEPAWVFSQPAPGDVAWWRRRQALETAVHLWDMQRAAGIEPAPLDPELAAEGIDELVTGFVPGHLRRNPVPGLTGTLHLHCTDADGEWTLDFDRPEPVVERAHSKAGTALRGPASTLYLWAWNRWPLDGRGLELFGDRAPAEAWSQVKL